MPLAIAMTVVMLIMTFILMLAVMMPVVMTPIAASPNPMMTLRLYVIIARHPNAIRIRPDCRVTDIDLNTDLRSCRGGNNKWQTE